MAFRLEARSGPAPLDRKSLAHVLDFDQADEGDPEAKGDSVDAGAERNAQGALASQANHPVALSVSLFWDSPLHPNQPAVANAETASNATAAGGSAFDGFSERAKSSLSGLAAPEWGDPVGCTSFGAGLYDDIVPAFGQPLGSPAADAAYEGAANSSSRAGQVSLLDAWVGGGRGVRHGPNKGQRKGKIGSGGGGGGGKNSAARPPSNGALYGGGFAGELRGATYALGCDPVPPFPVHNVWGCAAAKRFECFKCANPAAAAVRNRLHSDCPPPNPNPRSPPTPLPSKLRHSCFARDKWTPNVKMCACACFIFDNF